MPLPGWVSPMVSPSLLCLAPSQMWSLEGGDLIHGSVQPQCWAQASTLVS